MEGTRTKLMANFRESRFGASVHKYFNPDTFEARKFRELCLVGFAITILGELVVYILLKHSEEMGDVPYYTTDVLIMGIASLEFLLCWFLGWLGSFKRRTIMLATYAVLLACSLPVFVVPQSEVIRDSGLCSVAAPPSFPDGISTNVAVRLALLVIFALSCAIGRVIILSHTMAYLNELSPGDGTHMHLCCLLLNRVLMPFIGYSFLKSFTSESHWVQQLAIVIKCLIMLVFLHRYPIVAPGVDRKNTNDRDLCSSLGRVLSNRVAMLQMIALGLLAACLWNFSVHDVDFAKVKFHMKEYAATTLGLVRMFTIIFGAVLAGFMYSSPVMPKYDMKASVRTAILMCLLTLINYCVMTQTGNCDLGQIAGLGDQYSQPACGLNCGCDRPWIQFTPVCAHDDETTYFSPCHAGCSTAGTINNVEVYTNCTCASGGHVTVGPCDNGGCAEAHELHQLLIIIATLTCLLGIACQGAVIIQTVDPRDVSVAVGLASGIIALFAFVGGHGLYMWISSSNCAFARDSKCLFHQESFVPWVGFTSAVLAGGSLVFCVVTFVVMSCQKPKEDEEELTSRANL